jgi:hypothetical protein
VCRCCGSLNYAEDLNLSIEQQGHSLESWIPSTRKTRAGLIHVSFAIKMADRILSSSTSEFLFVVSCVQWIDEASNEPLDGAATQLRKQDMGPVQFLELSFESFQRMHACYHMMISLDLVHQNFVHALTKCVQRFQDEGRTIPVLHARELHVEVCWYRSMLNLRRFFTKIQLFGNHKT